MGCDGGTIPRRDELVRVKKKPEQKDKDAEREFRWLYCALTQERLQEPIVMCGLGRLYSKQNVIERLLEKDKMPESAQHIKSMKDIKTLNLEPNPAYVAEERSGDAPRANNAPYICKLIGLEMSGKFRFVALWSCGCVMSERALKQIKGAANVCPLCQMPFSIEDVIVLNGSEEDQELMQVKIEMRNAKRKASKKEKKQRKGGQEQASVTTTETVVLNDDKPDSKDADVPVESTKVNVNGKEQTSSDATVSSSKPSASNSSSSGSRSRIVANPKRPGSANENLLEDPDMKRLKTDYSVAKDPKASDVYKSLFTSHKSEKEQSRAHWVTYNPFYN